MPVPTNAANLIPGGPGHRTGRLQKIARRVLIAADGMVTTADFMAAIYARGEPWTHARWYTARTAARRYAEPVSPRSRPLQWRARPGVIPD
jgi:hypothetical protein